MKHSIILAGAAVRALAGTTAWASGALTQPVHQITIQLPGGGIETIQYAGDVAPRVTVGQAPLGAAWPGMIPFGPDPAFASLERLSAEMDRQMDALFRQAEAMARAPLPDNQALFDASLHNAPPGSASYSWISTSNGSNFCARMTEITTSSNGGKPNVVTRSSGNCGAGDAAPHAAKTGNPI